MTDTPHINPAYDKEMTKMAFLLHSMEEALRQQMQDSKEAFVNMDSQRAKAVRHKDTALNQMKAQSVEQSIAILARYQPMAEDLRKVVSSFKTAIEYERIGDYLKNFASSVTNFAKHDESLMVFPLIVQMMDAVQQQFGDFLISCADDDIPAAIAVWQRDNDIDDLFKMLIHDALKNHKQDDGNAHSLVQAVLVANNLERIGDRVKNLVEIFYYQKTGKTLESEYE